MTREDAKNVLLDKEYSIKNYSKELYIDDIFDYFEPIEQIAKQKVLDSFNGINCSNCKHISTKCDIFKNNYKYILETRGLEISKYKFICGLWERKDNND